MTTNNTTTTTKRSNTPKSTMIPIRCGDCAHFTKSACASLGTKPCKQLGVETFGAACRHFYPDYSVLASKATVDNLSELAKMARDMSESQLRIMSYIFRNAATLSKTGFKFGQPVFFNLSAPTMDYLDCYYSGYVLGLSPSKEHVQIVGASDLEFHGSDFRGVSLWMPATSLMTKSQFGKHRTLLEREGKLEIPLEFAHLAPKAIRQTKVVKKSKLKDTSDVPTIDTVDASWFDKMNATNLSDRRKTDRRSDGGKTKAPRRKEVRDLVSIFTIE